MTEHEHTLPELFTATPRVIDLPALRAHVRETSRWVIGEAVGEQLGAEQCDALAEELTAILADGMTPTLTAEITRNTNKLIADSQGDPVAFDWRGEMTVGGLTVPELTRLIDAVGQLVDHGVGETLGLLHDSQQRALFQAHSAWAAKPGNGTSTDA